MLKCYKESQKCRLNAHVRKLQVETQSTGSFSLIKKGVMVDLKFLGKLLKSCIKLKI